MRKEAVYAQSNLLQGSFGAATSSAEVTAFREAEGDVNVEEPVIVEFYLGVTRCPDGIAAGAYDIASRNTGLSITCWPNRKNQLKPIPWNHVFGVPLWQQEMAVLIRELTPQIQEGMNLARVRAHWAKLWKVLQEIPEEEAIEFDKRRGEARRRVWDDDRRKISAYNSVFCAHDECALCKQIDCDCKCHEVKK